MVCHHNKIKEVSTMFLFRISSPNTRKTKNKNKTRLTITEKQKPNEMCRETVIYRRVYFKFKAMGTSTIHKYVNLLTRGGRDEGHISGNKASIKTRSHRCSTKETLILLCTVFSLINKKNWIFHSYRFNDKNKQSHVRSYRIFREFKITPCSFKTGPEECYESFILSIHF